MRHLLLLSLLASLARPVIIDQIAITVERRVITQSQIDEEIRVTAFLNQLPAGFSLDQHRKAAARLVDQALIQEEMDLTHYPPADEALVDAALAAVKAVYGNTDAWHRSLQVQQLDENDLRRHLASQIRTLQFIGFRFRPDTGIAQSDIQDRYKQQMAHWPDGHPNQPAPDFASSRDKIRHQLVEERTDRALNDWLLRARRQGRITYLDGTLVAGGGE
jgi:hypothetical protein